jgi:hypothetical protein
MEQCDLRPVSYDKGKSQYIPERSSWCGNGEEAEGKVSDSLLP